MNDPLKPQTPMITSSRLSKTFHEVLHDKDALPYLIQFLSANNAQHIIKFWLDAESFQASAWTRIRSQQSLKHSTSARTTPRGSRSAMTPPSSPGGTAARDAGSECANCDKNREGGEDTSRNSCDKGAGTEADCSPLDGATSHGAMNNGATSESPAGRVSHVSSSHGNPPETDPVNSNQSADSSSEHVTCSPPHPPSSTIISDSSQTQQDEQTGSLSPTRSQPPPASGPSPEPPGSQSSPTSPTAQAHSAVSFQQKLKKSEYTVNIHPLFI